jgi:ankyrin repeat protein
MAIERDSLDAVMVLVENGLNPKFDYNYALRLAVQKKTPRMVDYLLSQGLRIPKKFLPLTMAAKTGNIDIFKAIFDTHDGVSLDKLRSVFLYLVTIVENGYMDLFKYAHSQMVTNGCCLDSEGYTILLSYASTQELCELLIDLGADIKNGLLIETQARYNRLDIVKFLVSRGATGFTWRELAWACHYNNLEMVQYLVAMGAEPVHPRRIYYDGEPKTNPATDPNIYKFFQLYENLATYDGNCCVIL